MILLLAASGIAAVSVTVFVIVRQSGPSRSVRAYCAYFYVYEEGTKLTARFSAATNFKTDPLGAIGTPLEVPRDLAVFFHQLSLRASESIGSDVQTLSDDFQHEWDNEGQDALDPSGGLVSGLGPMEVDIRRC
jgi:hypothetical protein